MYLYLHLLKDNCILTHVIISVSVFRYSYVYSYIPISFYVSNYRYESILPLNQSNSQQLKDVQGMWQSRKLNILQDSFLIKQ